MAPCEMNGSKLLQNNKHNLQLFLKVELMDVDAILVGSKRLFGSVCVGKSPFPSTNVASLVTTGNGRYIKWYHKIPGQTDSRSHIQCPPLQSNC